MQEEKLLRAMLAAKEEWEGEIFIVLLLGWIPFQTSRIPTSLATVCENGAEPANFGTSPRSRGKTPQHGRLNISRWERDPNTCIS
jgi:hypothetical protein